MGAIDPMLTRNYGNNIKTKSASIEINNQPMAQALQYQYGFDDRSSSPMNEIIIRPREHRGNDNRTCDSGLNLKDSRENYSSPVSFQDKAKKLLTLSPGTLKPSVSTSCLLTAEDQSTGSNALVCVPTRASLTHEWKKLKTPNKCRECNLLVYFNGRECSFCGFVAHKKCVTTLVIKCSGQRVTELASSKNRKQLKQQHTIDPQTSKSVSSATVSKKNAKSNSNNNQLVQPIFGQAISNIKDSHQVIDFIRRFIYEIDSRGLTSRGIYRVSSIKSKVDRLCNYFDQNLSNLIDLSSFHPNIIANALKMYLRQLPEPLLTHELYNDFIEIAKKYPNTQNPSNNTNKENKNSKNNHQSSTTARSNYMKHRRPYTLAATAISISIDPDYNPMLIVELREVIDSLPAINRQLIAIIMRHLKRVADMSAENQMSATNLSIIFGPTLLNAQDNKSLAIVDNIHQARVVELMITWAEQIFPQYANYESKAVIELDLPRGLNEQMDNDKDNNDNDNFNNDARDQMLTKTRQDLKESRRKFFTNPTKQTNYICNSQPPPLPLPPQTPQLDAADNAQQFDTRIRKLCSYNPPGSVPVIKMQPCFCSILSKYNDKKRSR